MVDAVEWEMTHMIDSLKDKRYLGDGVYAGTDGYHVWIWTKRENGLHAIALEDTVMRALQRYGADLERRRKEARDDQGR